METVQGQKAVVRARGGLGNQLFQLAISLQITQGDLRSITWSPHRPHRANFIDSIDELDRRKSCPSLLLNFQPDRLPFLEKTGLPGWRKVCFEGVQVGFTNWSVHKETFALEGYFQVSKIAKVHAQRIKSIMANRIDPKALREQLNLRPNEKFGAIHLRLGDYTSLAKTYGQPCAEEMVRCAKNAWKKSDIDHVLVFSDEPELAREMITPFARESVFTYVHGGSVEQHLILMSEAKFLVGSNSTFSIWANLMSDESLLFLPRPFNRGGALTPPKSLLLADWESYTCKAEH